MIGDQRDYMAFAPLGTDAPGRYEYRITTLDQHGNDWSIVAQFAVTP
jgi:hypothetical protein